MQEDCLVMYQHWIHRAQRKRMHSSATSTIASPTNWPSLQAG